MLRRRSLVAVGLLLVALGSAACGGNVVFVGDGEGGAGAGTTGFSATASVGQGGASSSQTNASVVATGVTATSSSTGSGVACENDVCMIGQTVCACDGQCSFCNDVDCFSISTRTECHWVEDGAQCDCILPDGGPGTMVGSCIQGNLDCDTTTGCCAPLFQQALQNGP